MTAQAQANWRDLLPTHSWPSSEGGPVHGWPTIAEGTQSIPVIPYEEDKGKNFLGGFVNQLKDMWKNRGDGGYRSDSDTPGDFYTEFVPHPQTGELVHPGVVDQWNRDQNLKFKNYF